VMDSAAGALVGVVAEVHWEGVWDGGVMGWLRSGFGWALGRGLSQSGSAGDSMLRAC
jgi:hypothetical protein